MAVAQRRGRPRQKQQQQQQQPPRQADLVAPAWPSMGRTRLVRSAIETSEEEKRQANGVPLAVVLAYAEAREDDEEDEDEEDEQRRFGRGGRRAGFQQRRE